MKASKSPLQKFKPFFDYAESFKEVNPKISFTIRNFAVKEISELYKKNPTSFNPAEKKEFENLVKSTIILKNELKEEANCSPEEFIEFLENLFANVDDEDRYGEVTMKTVQRFRVVGDLIDVLKNWHIDDEAWNKRKKYCKFKAVDIYKCIKQGIAPKRGGPKEEENDELNNELNGMIKDSENDKTQTNAIPDITNNTKPLPLNSDKNDANVGFDAFQSNFSRSIILDENNNTDEGIKKNDKPKDIDIKNINYVPSVYDQNIHTNPNIGSTPLYPFPSFNNVDPNTKSPTKNYSPPVNPNIPPIQKINLPENNISPTNVNIPTNYNDLSPYNVNPNVPPHNISPNNPKPIYPPSHNIIKPDHLQPKIEKPKISPRPSIDESKSNHNPNKVTNIGVSVISDPKLKNIDFTNKIKMKTPDYFKVIEATQKLLSVAKSEYTYDKIEKTLSNLELALTYLYNIDK